jgi:hypothetical protein
MPRWLFVLFAILFFPITVVVLIVRSKWSIRTKLLLSVAWAILLSAVLVTSGSNQNLTSQTAQLSSPSSEARPESLPSSSASRVPSPSIKPSPTPTPLSPTQTPQQPVVAQTTVTFVNAPLAASRGSNVTLQARTSPNTNCSIEVDYKSGPSTASGLVPKTSDSAGNVSWTWKVGTNTTLGSWPITVTCGNGSAQTQISVT